MRSTIIVLFVFFMSGVGINYMKLLSDNMLLFFSVLLFAVVLLIVVKLIKREFNTTHWYDDVHTMD